MNNSAFAKIMKDLKKRRDIGYVTTNRRKKYLVLEPNNHTTKWISKKNISNWNLKTKWK